MSKVGRKVKPWLLSLGLVSLAGCEYLPHYAKVDLAQQQVVQVVEQAKVADDVIMQAFETHHLVAIGDYHWNEAFIRYATKLVSKPAFSEQVNHVVVEFGNAKYQSVLDDYLAGEEVSESQLNTMLRGSLYFMAWMPDVYRDFFKAIKQRNEALPEGKKIQVHLAEAPFDWDEMQDVKVWKKAAKNKTDHFYQVASERIKNNEKALMIFGAFHLVNAPANYVKKTQETDWPLATRLQQAFPDSTYLIWPMTDPEVVKTFNALKSPAVLEVGQGPMRDLRLIDFLPKARYKLAAMDDIDAKVGELFDAFLYLGENQRTMVFPRDVVADREWVGEMQRRVDLIGGKMQESFNQLIERSDEQYGFASKS
ncbi:hypothetical protein [Vibrio sp. STUT-A11]|uniref:hypothetical protein n=1 Tax=unclassified Vibrio TaxID=2614977 RepID=UPI00222F31E4|nr:hypothetical protein [Vibrio sp. STUT-A11]BDR14163.1 hypothetical protein VspSTUT11_21390 [Vibrio sp. STUT-A11]